MATGGLWRNRLALPHTPTHWPTDHISANEVFLFFYCWPKFLARLLSGIFLAQADQNKPVDLSIIGCVCMHRGYAPARGVRFEVTSFFFFFFRLLCVFSFPDRNCPHPNKSTWHSILQRLSCPYCHNVCALVNIWTVSCRLSSCVVGRPATNNYFLWTNLSIFFPPDYLSWLSSLFAPLILDFC